MAKGKKKRPAATEDESSSSNERSNRSNDDRSSDDDSRETSKHRRRRSQARRKKSRKERSYSQGKEIEKLLAEVIKEEVRKQFDMIREEMCQQSKQQATDESKEEISKQLEKVREEMCQQSKQAAESTEDICKQLNKVKEDLTEIHNDLCKQRELYTNDTSGDAFDAPRSQSNQVQAPRYRLVFKSGAIDKIDKGQPFDISVALVDGNDQTVENGLLASATVELVVVKAEFNQHNNQYNWSREDFESNIIKKEHQGNSATVDVDQSLKSMVSDGRFNLFQGFKCHSGSKIFRNSGNKKVRLGVMIVSPTEERVLEGLSNPFFVRGHDRPARQSNLCHNRSNTQRKALVDNGYQLQNGQTPNPQNPLSPSATQNNGGISGLNTTTRQPQLPFVGNTTLLSSGLNINGEPQLPSVGNTHISTEPSTSQQQRASIQHDPFPHMPMMTQATNNQIDELPSSALVGHLGSPNYVGNGHVPVHEFELPGRGGDTTDIGNFMMRTEELLPGFRFSPVDNELILDYLLRRATGARFMVSIMAEVDIYKIEPWDLPCRAKLGEFEWYFLHRREHDESYATGTCPNRTTETGYWKATGIDKPITVSAGDGLMTVGFKKALVFYRGRPPMGEKTNWIMQEYRLHDNLLSANESASSTSSTSDEWLLYKVYTKSEPNQLTTPSQDDSLLQQLRLQDDDLSHSFLPPAPSTMPSTSSSISDCITHLTPTPTTLEPPSSPWPLLWSW